MSEAFVTRLTPEQRKNLIAYLRAVHLCTSPVTMDRISQLMESDYGVDDGHKAYEDLKETLHL